MTPAQAREYATRIRLGEPVYWHANFRLPGDRAVFADGTVVAHASPYGEAPWGFPREPRVSMLDPGGISPLAPLKVVSCLAWLDAVGATNAP
jgi:hypothetical protein